MEVDFGRILSWTVLVVLSGAAVGFFWWDRIESQEKRALERQEPAMSEIGEQELGADSEARLVAMGNPEPTDRPTRSRHRRPARREPGDPSSDPSAVNSSTRDARQTPQARQEPDDEELAAARERVDIVMYMVETCPYCRRARAYLTEHNISYVEMNVADDLSAQSEMRRINPRGSVPTFTIDGAVMVGFNGTELHRAIERAARKRLQ
jgi:glutaredoxin